LRKSPRGWKGPFEDPIPLPRGRQLVTLKDAADYIMKLPKVEQNLAEWQAATEALIMAAEGRGPLLHARVGMLPALNRHERLFDPDRKDTRRGKRKLALDSLGWHRMMVERVYDPDDDTTDVVLKRCQRPVAPPAL
jgi:hypothetical protein